MRIVAAFAPVDDESSVLYLRTYQRLPWAGPLARVICRLSMPANDYIARQDRRVVETQRPYRPELRGGEKLVPADGAIIAYRRRRSELQAGSVGAPAASAPARHSS